MRKAKAEVSEMRDHSYPEECRESAFRRRIALSEEGVADLAKGGLNVGLNLGRSVGEQREDHLSQLPKDGQVLDADRWPCIFILNGKVGHD